MVLLGHFSLIMIDLFFPTPRVILDFKLEGFSRLHDARGCKWSVDQGPSPADPFKNGLLKWRQLMVLLYIMGLSASL